MDSILDELVRFARRCERAASLFKKEPVETMISRLLETCGEIGQAWCGSWLGYHSTIYIENLRPKRPGEHFDAEWGGMDAMSNRSRGTWCEYDFQAVRSEILRRAGVNDLTPINDAVDVAAEAFEAAKQEILPAVDAMLSGNDDPTLRGIREKIDRLTDHISAEDFATVWIPRGQHFTRDSLAAGGGVQVPHHFRFQGWLMERASWGNQAEELAKLTNQAVKYLKYKLNMKGKTVAKTEGKVYIGHGHSQAWKDLKDFLQDRLSLEWDEFNREPTAGYATKERLQAMVDDACFAFLVMTGEDGQQDGTLRARENVIHEIGLFQGRLGFEKAIILLEEGCSEFSNIVGVTQIRFPKGNIMAKSEEIRRVLEREKIV